MSHATGRSGASAGRRATGAGCRRVSAAAARSARRDVGVARSHRDALDHLGEKPRAGEKARLRARARRRRAAAPRTRARAHRARRARARLARSALGRLGASATPCCASSCRMRRLPKRGCARMDARFDEALVATGSGWPRASRAAHRPRRGRGSAPRRRPRRVGLRRVARAAWRSSLRRSSSAALLALRQQLQRARLQRAARACAASVAASVLDDLQLGRRFGLGAPGSSGMPIASRTLFSISTARSGFSRRNSRALSLPWPIFSPL